MMSLIKNEIRIHGKAKTCGTVIAGTLGVITFCAMIYVAFWGLSIIYPGA